MKKYQESYFSVNGIQEYVLWYPIKDKPVMVYLHGGPGQSMMPFAGYLNKKIDFVTTVYYDQRGTGRTQLKSQSTHEAITLDQLLDDLKKTIEILKKELCVDKVMLLGHSWGSVLGNQYALKYPQDLLCYIGVGQVVNHRKAEKCGYDHLMELAGNQLDEKDRQILSELGDYPQNVTKENAYETITKFRDLQIKHRLAAAAGTYLKIALKSETFRLKDLKAMKQIMQNIHLLETMIDYSVENQTKYEVPVYYILGKEDWQVASIVAAAYFETIDAPEKQLFWIENAGHLPNVDQPEMFNTALKQVTDKFI